MTCLAESAVPAGVRFLVLGDSAVSVEFGQEINIEINRKVMALQSCVERAASEGELEEIVETIGNLRRDKPRHGFGRNLLSGIFLALVFRPNAPNQQAVGIDTVGGAGE